MKKTHISLTLSIIFVLVFNNIALSWTGETHANLSKYAAENSVLSKNKDDYLKNLGFVDALDTSVKWGEEKSITKWLAKGADLEDASRSSEILANHARFNNHFHNPLKPWDQAGLNDTFLLRTYTGISSLMWAQDGTYQQTFDEGDWSWQTIRDYYYLALTSTTDASRQENFAKTFRGLGHQMHIIQDAAQPDHVRNDMHVEDSIFKRNQFGSLYFESWAEKQKSFINSLASNPLFPEVSLAVSYSGLAPITQFLDTEQYNGTGPSTSPAQGIAEYTNANFVSDDTILTEDLPLDDRHYFPYPRKSSTDLQSFIDENKLPETVIGEDGIPDTGFWIAKTGDGENIGHFLRPRYLTRNPAIRTYSEDLYRRSFYRDERCHEDYAQKLIPRAVGYSAGLLDYFFRGDIDMVADDVTGSGYIIVNNTEENMDGLFEIYYDNINDERIQLWSGSFILGTLSSGNNKSGNIDFTLPSDAKEPGKYMVVFRGVMGNETDAVVGKISIICFWNENFTGSDGSSPDSNKWYSHTSNFNSYAEISGNRLHHSLNSGYVFPNPFYVKTNFKLYNQITEPFDVEVYCEDNDSLPFVVSYITFLHAGFYLTYFDGQGVDTDLRFGRSNAINGNKTILFRVPGTYLEAANDWQTFHLRLVGENGIITAYYKHYEGDDWIELGSGSSPLTTVTRLGLTHYARTTGNSISRDFYFDDLRFNNGCPTAP